MSWVRITGNSNPIINIYPLYTALQCIYYILSCLSGFWGFLNTTHLCQYATIHLHLRSLSTCSTDHCPCYRCVAILPTTTCGCGNESSTVLNFAGTLSPENHSVELLCCCFPVQCCDSETNQYKKCPAGYYCPTGQFCSKDQRGNSNTVNLN